MGRHLFCFKAIRPLGFLEAHEDKIVPYQQRALDQHTVCGEELQHLVLAHLWQLVLQLHGLIQQAAGVEKFLQRQSTALVPCSQLVISRVLQLDVAEIVGNVVFVQPLSRLLAGGAFGVANKGHGSRSCSVQ